MTVDDSNSKNLILHFINKKKHPVWKVDKFFIPVKSNDEKQKLKNEIDTLIDSSWPGNILKLMFSSELAECISNVVYFSYE